MTIEPDHKRRAPKVQAFFIDRGPGLSVVVLIMLIVSMVQSSISTSLFYGTVVALLSPVITEDAVLREVAPALEIMRSGIVVAAAILLLFKRKTWLFRLIIADSFLFTLGLLGQTGSLLEELFGSAKIDPHTLMRNVVLMIVSNILIFSLWYWIIDPPGVERRRHDVRWEFLFPQRGGPLPHYENWEPHYVDYLFLAFMTSFAFSPTDTLPLTARAKMLMLLQASISVITLVVIASGGINIISGSK
jgi:hypothetical protein